MLLHLIYVLIAFNGVGFYPMSLTGCLVLLNKILLLELLHLTQIYLRHNKS